VVRQKFQNGVMDAVRKTEDLKISKNAKNQRIDKNLHASMNPQIRNNPKKCLNLLVGDE
jgi:hypothetical protein